jgi:hypothetical protein
MRGLSFLRSGVCYFLQAENLKVIQISEIPVLRGSIREVVRASGSFFVHPEVRRVFRGISGRAYSPTGAMVLRLFA